MPIPNEILAQLSVSAAQPSAQRREDHQETISMLELIGGQSAICGHNPGLKDVLDDLDLDEPSIGNIYKTDPEPKKE